MCRSNEVRSEIRKSEVMSAADNIQSRLGVEALTQRDLTRLQPLLWLEVSAVFDKYNVPLKKRKPNKRRVKGWHRIRGER